MMDLEPTYVINNSEQVETFLMNTCPGNCSSNGNCTKLGICSCNTFYHGAKCTIDERDPLVIDDIEGGGLCDLADGDECVCFTIRSDNLLNGFKCKIQTTLYIINGTKYQNMANIEEGDYADIFTGVCCDNGDIWSENEHVFGRVYDVSISNDGGVFSNIATVDVLNSACQEIVTDARPTFRLKNQTCFIDGLCYLDGDVSYKQTTACFSCESSVEAYDWTEKPCPTTTTVSTTVTSSLSTSVASTINTSTTTSTSASTTPETSSQSSTTMTTKSSSVGSTSSRETRSPSTTAMTTETSSVGSTSSPETSSPSTTSMEIDKSSIGSTSSPETRSSTTTSMETDKTNVGSTSSPETSSPSTTAMTTETSSVGSTSSPETSSSSTTSMETDKTSVGSTSSPETSSPSTTSMTTETTNVGSTSTTLETDTSSFATTPSKTAAPETQTRNLGLIIGLSTGVPVIVTAIAVITVIIVVRFKKIKSTALKLKQSGHVATHGRDKDSSLDLKNRSFYFANPLNKDYKGLPVARSGHFNVEGQTFSTSASSQSFEDLSAVSIDLKTSFD